MDALKELVDELNKKVEDLNSALYVEDLLSLIEDSIGTFYPHQSRLVEDLLSLIEDITEIANALSDEIND